jgi:beta-galactosidase beta subunit
LKIQFKALNGFVGEVMKLYADNNKEVTLIQTSPVILQEEYEDKHIDYMLKTIAKKLKVPELIITQNKIYINSLQNKFRKKASKQLNVDKKYIEVKVL